MLQHDDIVRLMRSRRPSLDRSARVTVVSVANLSTSTQSLLVEPWGDCIELQANEVVLVIAVAPADSPFVSDVTVGRSADYVSVWNNGAAETFLITREDGSVLWEDDSIADLTRPDDTGG